MISDSYDYQVKLSFNRDKADWFENIIGIENVNKYIMKLVDEDIEKELEALKTKFKKAS